MSEPEIILKFSCQARKTLRSTVGFSVKFQFNLAINNKLKTFTIMINRAIILTSCVSFSDSDCPRPSLSV